MNKVSNILFKTFHSCSKQTPRGHPNAAASSLQTRHPAQLLKSIRSRSVGDAVLWFSVRGLIGPWSAPWSGAPSPSMAGGPLSHCAINKGWSRRPGFYSSENHSQPLDRFGRSRLAADRAGQNRPRRARKFLAQAQVAAWAWGKGPRANC